MLSHGMAEHAGRYERLAAALNAAGYHFYAIDQRGHGRTAEADELGHFADQGGWGKVVGDLASLNHHIRQQHPELPIFLLGHSMGSYISMAYLLHHSCSLQGAILSGSNYQPQALYRVARLIARFERWRQGPLGKSALIDFLSFGSFNKAFKPNRTAFDWLSRDPQEVDRYVADPLCGFRCSNQLWVDLLGGLADITPPTHLRQIDADLPLLIIGGERDPVSQGKRLGDLTDALRGAGLRQVTLKTYPEARHELFNESNRDAVTQDLIDWLEQALRHRRIIRQRREHEPGPEHSLRRARGRAKGRVHQQHRRARPAVVRRSLRRPQPGASGRRLRGHHPVQGTHRPRHAQRRLISAAIATVLPGPGTIYLGQTLRFTRPVKLGDDLKVELEVLEKLPKNRVRMATRVFNQAGKQVVDGEAEIMAPEEKLSVELAELPPISIG